MADTKPVKPERPMKEILPAEESALEADEKAIEAAPETKDTFLEKAEAAPPAMPAAAKPAAPAPQVEVPAKDQVTLEVEKIMEEGLGSMYETLPESAKQKFKEKGELAAREISAMVRTLKLQVKKVLHLIRDWLLTIPGINKFFLEQEAKIKTDKLKELVDARKEENLKQP